MVLGQPFSGTIPLLFHLSPQFPWILQPSALPYKVDLCPALSHMLEFQPKAFLLDED